VSGFSDVEEFTPQRIDSVFITANDSQSGNSQSLGRVSFSKDQSTVQGISGALKKGNSDVHIFLKQFSQNYAVRLRNLTELNFGDTEHKNLY
jgi:hypothetical protein